MLLRVPLLLLLLLPACDSGQEPLPEPRQRDLTRMEEVLVTSSNAFGLRLFGRISELRNGENVLLSPLSVSLALGMAMNGANGATRTEMHSVLSLPDVSQADINRNYQSLIALMRDRDNTSTMLIANGLWSRLGFSIMPAFADTLREYFDAEAHSLDFSAPGAAEEINGWVNDKTRGTIRSIVPSPIPPEVMLYLVNALYFNAQWTHRFDPARTDDAEFTRFDGSRQIVRMMQREGTMGVLRMDGVEGVELTYGNGAFSMVLLLPPPGQPITTFISELDDSRWSELIAGISGKETAIVHLPRFTMTGTESLEEVLAAMGMPHAFDPSAADFTGIHPDGDLFISSVRHNTFIRVDEEGTEASAATAVEIGTTSVPQAIRFDRPFVFALRERSSGVLFFLGKVGNVE